MRQRATCELAPIQDLLPVQTGEPTIAGPECYETTCSLPGSE